MAIAALYVINRNFWALAAFLLIFLAPQIAVTMPRLCYVFYPLHLLVLWIITKV